jgi:hypothetical protein
MSRSSDAPAWMSGVAKDVMSYQQQHLIDVMLERNEDITDDALWRLRRSQLDRQLEQARAAKG